MCQRTIEPTAAVIKRKHKQSSQYAFITQIHGNNATFVELSGTRGTGYLQGILLSPVAPHGSTGQSMSQLTVMGRFTLTDSADALLFDIGLYGTQAAEQVLEITATRTRDNQKTIFELTPAASSRVIFPDSALARQKPMAWHL
jgi:hypothetical protein